MANFNESIRETFFQECEDQLAELEAGLLAIERGKQDSETVNAIFRAVHSIKGGAGAFHLEDLVRFAHAFETLLDDIRSGAVKATLACAKELLRAADVLADLVRAARQNERVDSARYESIIKILRSLSGQSETPANSADEEDDFIDFTPIQVNFDDICVTVQETAKIPAWTIKFQPTRRLYDNGNEPALLIHELSQLGTLRATCDISALPSLESINPEESYLSWVFELNTLADESAIREIFDFVINDCALEIKSVDATFESDGSAANDEVAEVMDLLKRLESEIAAGEPNPEEPPSVIARTTQDPAHIEAIAEHAPLVHEPIGGPETKALAQPRMAQPATTIRVDTDRVDRLVDFIGELVINQAMLAQWIAESGMTSGSPIANGLDELERLTREIQDSVMAIRAQPVQPVFQRMGRIVREVAEATCKSVRLICEGESTEIDKTVIERIAEPLTHMIRNAIDHGIEKPAARIAAGKKPEGVVLLSAKHRSGRIVIEVADDGAGINRTRVREIAQEKGLIAADTRLTDNEVDNLIFAPGFSTAESVSSISGRGVGMDVVKKSIQSLGGRVSITSEPGKGSVFTLSLPLTLAVLDGMVVVVAGQTLVLPLTAIVETLQLKAEILHPLGACGHVISVRDTLTPLVDVGFALNMRARETDPSTGIVILVESEQGGRSALLVDSIQEQRQIVVKSLESNYGRIPGIAAATILGNGRVALIMDVDALIALNGPQRQSAAA